MAAVIRAVSLAALLAALGSQAAPADEPRVIESRGGVQITYRAVPGNICETTPGVKSYSGYIDIPATLDPAFQPYNASLFFWFFESRVLSKAAPLTVWLQGGPGFASVHHAVSGLNGPCIVQHDSNSTKLNPYSWNDFTNMLYIDQPVQTGYSYDTIIEGFRDMVSGDTTPGGTGPSTPVHRKGKFGSGDPTKTANTTAIAAKTLSHFLDLWFGQYTQYKRDKINIWTQSYGGHYAPALATLLLQQGKIGVNSVGIINGLIDAGKQIPYWPEFAVNNTYGIKAYSDDHYVEAQTAYSQPGGCRDQANACFALQAEGDPNNYANNSTVNTYCAAAGTYCSNYVLGPYFIYSGRNEFDIADVNPVTFPPPYSIGYMNNKWVMDALGAKVNFTERNFVTVNRLFERTADSGRGYTKEIGSLLDAGVKVSLLHGDRDYLCNWFGGENVSLSIPYSHSTQFAAAGYKPMTLIPGQSVTGQVRQYGKFSFARVYQAGHEGPYYKPAVYLAAYQRTILGLDLATGLTVVGNGYSTTGPASVRNVNNVAPAGPPGVDLTAVECYVDATPLGFPDSRCTDAQLAALQDGTYVINSDRIVVQPAA